MTEALPIYQEEPPPQLAVLPGGLEPMPIEQPKVITPENPGLSTRQLEILEAVSRGLTYRLIGKSMFLAESSVKRYVPEIHKKLGAASISHAVNIGFNIGLLTPDGQVASTSPLTAREHEVLIASAWTDSAMDAGRRLGLEVHTVKFHKTNIFKKLGAKNLSHAIRLGYETGQFAHGPAEKPHTRELKLTKAQLAELTNGSYGMSAAESGKSQYKANETCKFHRNGLYQKLDAANMPQAVAKGFELGLLQPDQPSSYNLHLTSAMTRQLYYAAAGLDWREAAKATGVAPETVRDHRQRVRLELGAKNMSHAVRLAYENGFLPLPQTDSQ